MGVYSYWQGRSALHRLPAGGKLLGLVVVSGAGFWAFPVGLVFAAAALVCFSALAKISVWRLFRGCGGLFVMAVLVVASNSVVWRPIGFAVGGFWSGLRYGAGLLVSFGACGLFFAVTTMSELRDSLDAVALRLRLPWLCWLSLGLSLMLGFLPRFFEVWEEASLAYKARGGRNGLSKMLFLVPLATERMIEMAAETAAALEMRGTGM